MSWHIYPAHYVSHLNPTLQNGWGEGDGYPVENVNSLDDTHPYITAAGASGNYRIDFDRGHTNGAAINGALILRNNMTGPGHAWTIEAADNSGFSTNLTTLVNSDTTKTQNIFFSFSANTQRYVGFEWERASGVGFKVGHFGVGKTYELGGPLIATERLGNRIIRTFKKVTRANAELLMEDYTRRYIPNVIDGSGAIDGIGGWGGRNPIALIDDSTSPDTVHWGHARVSAKGYAAYYSEVIVDMTPIYQGVLD